MPGTRESRGTSSHNHFLLVELLPKSLDAQRTRPTALWMICIKPYIPTPGLAHLLEHMAFKGTARIGTRDAGREAALLDALDEGEA